MSLRASQRSGALRHSRRYLMDTALPNGGAAVLQRMTDMIKPAAFIIAASLGLAGLTASIAPAEAQHWQQPRRWAGPQGHFVVNANACAPLRQYNHQRPRFHAQWNRHRNFVLRCQPGAFNYIPTRFELRRGITGQRIFVNQARWNPRRQQFFADTRWGPVAVHVTYAPVVFARRH